VKIIIFSTRLSCIPVLDYLGTQALLKAVVSTDKLKTQHVGLENYCNINNIHFLKVNRQDLLINIKNLFAEIQPDLVIMFGFSYRIPADIYQFPSLGFFNVHFSLLPACQGPDPLFWQMKNGATNGGVSIHKVDAGFDTGAVVMQQSLPFIPGETWGIADGRHSAVAVNMIVQLIEQLKNGNNIAELTVSPGTASYYPRATASDIAIDWDVQTAAQVEAQVNASNPGAGGAVTTFKQQLVRILEVSPVEATVEETFDAGTIVHADASGIYVQCADRKILRVNIIKLNEGFVTGAKLAAMGVQRGEKFENNMFEYHETNN
jgi:methionyl-tRNA formyltransferase